MTLGPLDQDHIRAIVREEIAADEMRRIASETRDGSAQGCPHCGCRHEAVPGSIPHRPGTAFFNAAGDAPR